MLTNKVEYLIVGAGVSGLSFATQVDDYLIIEKEMEPGGLCRTIKRNGFVWDYAGHFFHFQNPDIKDMFLSSIDRDDLVHRVKKTQIYRKHRLIDFPFQKNIHQLEKHDFIDCLYDLYFKTESESYSSFEEMLYGKFGKSITEMFLKPYNEKLYACNLDSLEQDAMGRFFPYAKIDEIIRNMKEEDNTSYNTTFLYPKGGASTFVDVLLGKLDCERILLGCELLGIDLENKVAQTSSGDMSYEHLVSTIPLNSLCSLIGLSTDELSSNKVLVFNLGFDRKSSYNDVHWLYFPEPDYNFYRVGFYDNILGGDRLSLYVEIGFTEEADLDIEEQLEQTLDGLSRIGIIKGLSLVDSEAIVINPAYVHITEASDSLKRKLLGKLDEKSLHVLGRYGKWTYCSIEDCIDWALELAKRLREQDIHSEKGSE